MRAIRNKMASRGKELTPSQLRVHVESFFKKALDELAKDGSWLTMEEFLKLCIQPVVYQSILALCHLRGRFGWREVVDAVLAHERGR